MQTRRTTEEIVRQYIDLDKLPVYLHPVVKQNLLPFISGGSVTKSDLLRAIFNVPELAPLRELQDATLASVLRCAPSLISKVFSHEHVVRKGRPRILSDEAEAKLAAWVRERCQSQTWPTLSAFKSEVLAHLHRENPNATPSSQYFYDLIERIMGDEYTIKQAYGMEQKRFEVERERLGRHFELLKHLGIEKVHPSLILNVDETGFGASKSGRIKPQKVILPKSFTGTPRFLEGEEKRFVSCIATTTASGLLLAPGLIASRKYDAQDAEKCSFYHHRRRYFSEKAFVPTDIFGDYIKSVVIPYIASMRELLKVPDAPAVLLCDGHKSHILQPFAPRITYHCMWFIRTHPTSSSR